MAIVHICHFKPRERLLESSHDILMEYLGLENVQSCYFSLSLGTVLPKESRYNYTRLFKVITEKAKLSTDITKGLVKLHF